MFRAVPVTLSLIALSVLGFLLVYLGAPVTWLAALTFSPFNISGDQIQFFYNAGQYWRFITPIFLHFGWLHIAFNSLWVWELGGLVEQRQGSIPLLGLVLLTASGSNLAQFLWSGPSLFGGLSGVVYALLGYCWVYNGLRPSSGLLVPKPIVMFMIGWLVFCMIGPTELLGIGSVANAAHLGGLVLGCICAVLSHLLGKVLRS